MPLQTLTSDLAARFADIALGHVGREYPNHLNHGLAGPEDARPPRQLHPIFYGSFDWHSSVHAHWLLARLMRRFPEMASAGAIRAWFAAQFTAAKVDGERAYFLAATAGGFERPYGWAWLLKLTTELRRFGEAGWAEALAPLAELIAGRFCEFLPRATYPVRSGAHFNTAFALGWRRTTPSLRQTRRWPDGSTMRRCAGTASTPIAPPGASRAATTFSRRR